MDNVEIFLERPKKCLASRRIPEVEGGEGEKTGKRAMKNRVGEGRVTGLADSQIGLYHSTIHKLDISKLYLLVVVGMDRKETTNNRNVFCLECDIFCKRRNKTTQRITKT